MTALVWTPGSYDLGLSRGVLYTDLAGYAWVGLTAYSENAGEQTDDPIYYDGVKVRIPPGTEDFGLHLEAFTYPPEFEEYEGLDNMFDRQPRKTFGLSYRTGNKLHLVWNATAAPSGKVYNTRNNEFELSIFTWDLSTTKKDVPGAFPSAHMVIDLELAPADAITDLEDTIYGTATATPYLPEPEDVINLFLSYALLVVVDNGDGTATITGPDEAIEMLSAIEGKITWPSVIYISMTTAKISTM